MSRCKFYVDYPLRISFDNPEIIHAASTPCTRDRIINGRLVKNCIYTTLACGVEPWSTPVTLRNVTTHKGNPSITCKNCLRALDGVETPDDLFAVLSPEGYFMNNGRPVDSLNKAKLYRKKDAILERYGTYNYTDSKENFKSTDDYWKVESPKSRAEHVLKPGYKMVPVCIKQVI